MSGSTRVEVKSTCLTWDRRRWYLCWSDVKVNDFDQLILVAYAPSQLIVWEWDGAGSLSRCGLKTETAGHVIKVLGPTGGAWQDSVSQIKKKCPGRLLLDTAVLSD